MGGEAYVPQPLALVTNSVQRPHFEPPAVASQVAVSVAPTPVRFPQFSLQMA